MTRKTPYGNTPYLRNRYYLISVFYMISWCFRYKQTGDFPRHTLQTEYNDSIASYHFVTFSYHILSLIDRFLLNTKSAFFLQGLTKPKTVSSEAEEMININTCQTSCIKYVNFIHFYNVSEFPRGLKSKMVGVLNNVR